MRKLASIQRITNIEPIEGKDRIAVATILGWKVIVQKNEFKVNDLCVYVEVDSVLPEQPYYEFLRSRCYSSKWKGFRIKAMKMAGIYSEGIVFPLSIFKDNSSLSINKSNFKEDKIIKEEFDCTEILSIRKYDPEAEFEKTANTIQIKNPILNFLFKFNWIRNIFFPKKSRKWPSKYISKTDETRIQAVSGILDTYSGTKCYISEKIDGCSASYLWADNRFMICSRNMVCNNKQSHYWNIAQIYNLKQKLKGTSYAIQGEIIGVGVGNGCGFNCYEERNNEFYVFNIIDTKRKVMLSLMEMKEVCQKLNLKMVPIIDENYTLGTDNVDGLLNMSKGFSKLNSKMEREGIVIRDIENKPQCINFVGQSLSFKVINPDFALKYLNKD